MVSHGNCPFIVSHWDSLHKHQNVPLFSVRSVAGWDSRRNKDLPKIYQGNSLKYHISKQQKEASLDLHTNLCLGESNQRSLECGNKSISYRSTRWWHHTDNKPFLHPERSSRAPLTNSKCPINTLFPNIKVFSSNPKRVRELLIYVLAICENPVFYQ